MRSTILLLAATAAAILFAVVALPALLGEDEFTPISAPAESQPSAVDKRQQLYDGFLSVARRNARDDPDLSCELAFQDLIIDQIDASGRERVLLQLAMTDACKEAGQLSSAAQFSPYYADAPKP
ncbi:hypothetical protein LCGC14_2541190 [marine sediment metagenome]|uniref:Uncharacterized protein n=1 Tax=marine sediment metagenome TaxID=412755 RepID=A0A0F9D273_9ZZZZ